MEIEKENKDQDISKNSDFSYGGIINNSNDPVDNNFIDNIESNLKYFLGDKINNIYNFGKEIYFEVNYENLFEVLNNLKNNEDFNFDILRNIKYKQKNNFLLIVLFSFEKSTALIIKVTNLNYRFDFDIKNFSFSLKEIFDNADRFLKQDDFNEENSDLIFYSQIPELLDTFDIYLTLDNELIKEAYLNDEISHFNKNIVINSKEINKLISVLSNFDYKDGITPELCFCMGIENLLQIKIPKRAIYIRMILSEIFRINCHLSYLVNMGIILENSLIFNSALMEKEKISSIIELITGSRVIPNFIRIGGVKKDIEDNTLIFINKSIPQLYKNIKRIEDIFFSDNVILEKLINKGILSSKVAKELGITGPNLRASSIRYDLRKNFDYLLYRDIAFTVPLGKIGDCFDRITIRFKEIYQSLKIIREIIHLLPIGAINKMINPTNLEFFESKIISTVEGAHGVYKMLIEVKENNKIEIIPITSIKNNIISCENSLKNCDFEDLLPIVSSFGIDSADLY